MNLRLSSVADANFPQAPAAWGSCGACANTWFYGTQALVYACTSPEPDDRPTADQALQEIDLIMKDMGLMQNPAPETESVTAGQGSLKIPNAQYQRVTGEFLLY